LAPAALSVTAFAAPTGLNTIPTTDLVPIGSLVGAFQNGNASFTGVGFYQQPQWLYQTQVGVKPWLEAGVDYAPTPNLNGDRFVFNVKALVLNENDTLPNVALGLWNVATGQGPGYYVTVSKTLNYEQEQEERFKAHHRRNRKLLGRRVHVGAMLDGRSIVQPFVGTDLQLSEIAVFQADWIHGSGNNATAGLAYVMPDNRTVINPAILFSNDSGRFAGIALNISHQFSF
jgi:hypothetical protein